VTLEAAALRSARGPVVADVYSHVVGVDTHAETHTYAVLDAKTGEVHDIQAHRADRDGISAALQWLAAALGGTVLLAIEGANSYGTLLTQMAEDAGLAVCDAHSPGLESGRSKSDEADAARTAFRMLGRPVTALSQPRARGARRILGLLVMSRRDMEVRAVALRNRLNAIVRTIDLGLDTTSKLDTEAVRTFARPEWVTGDRYEIIARREVSRLAGEYVRLKAQLEENKRELGLLVHEIAPGLLDVFGVGPVTGAVILGAYSHPGRVRSEAAFAALAGVAPVEHSSGKTIRYRLNRGGDRQLNRAIHTIVIVRLQRDDRSRSYFDRRIAAGATKKAAVRSLKRYVVREIYKRVDDIMRTRQGELGAARVRH
jgi:transposase